MTIKEYIDSILPVVINKNAVEQVRESYHFQNLPDDVKKMISLSGSGFFLDDEFFCRVLSLDDIIHAANELHVNFNKHALIPFLDLGDNDYVSFDYSNTKWCVFNIVEEFSYNIQNSLPEIFPHFSQTKTTQNQPIISDLKVQEITNIILQYMPAEWENASLEVVVHSGKITVLPQIETSDTQYSFLFDDKDAALIQNFFLNEWKNSAGSWQIAEYTIDSNGNYTISFE